MALEAALPAVTRPFALTRGLTSRVAVTVVVAVSFAARVVASAMHPTPLYFPDEYLYTSIARALGSGDAPAVRGSAAHFPALLAPLLAAPLQALFSPRLAYALTQMENALLMSLVAVPVYLLARRLALSTRYAVVCAVFSVAIPDMLYAAFTMSDAVAYPLALGATAAGVAAIDRPSRRGQLVFLALALLATSARVQFVVLPAAYVAASLAVDRRRAFRTQRLSLTLIGVPLLGALVVGSHRLLGYYSNVVHLHIGGHLVTWAATDLFLLAFASGIVLVPGALVALLRPHGRTQTAFAAFTGAYAACLLLEAALYASNGSTGFQERYLFSLLPLIPIAFGLYLMHGRPQRLAVVAVSFGLLIATARVPLSAYTSGSGSDDSPFLFAVVQVQLYLGTAGASLEFAFIGLAGAVGAALVAWRGGGRYAVGAAVLFVAVISVCAIVNDSANSRHVRSEALPTDPSWIDATGLRNVTLLQTVGSPPIRAFEQLYWNRSLNGEARLGPALPTDVYPAPRIRIAPDGTMRGVGSNVLLQEYAATARFANAQLVERVGTFSLWSAEGTPRLALLEQGRFSDGWLSRAGSLTVWPDAAGNTRGTLRFTLSLPRDGEPTTIAFGKARYDVQPGEKTTVIYTLDTRGPWSLDYKLVRGGNTSEDLRLLSVRSTPPVLERAVTPVQRVMSTA